MHIDVIHSEINNSIELMDSRGVKKVDTFTLKPCRRPKINTFFYQQWSLHTGWSISSLHFLGKYSA